MIKLPDVRVGAPAGPTLSAASLSQDGKILAIGIDDKDYSGLFTYELPSGKLLWTHGQGSAPAAIDISPDGSKLAVAYKVIGHEGGMCPHVEVLNATNGGTAVTLEFPAHDRAQSVAFSHDGRLLATAVQWQLDLWNTGGGVRFSSLEMPSDLGRFVDYAYSLVFSPDDALLAVSDPGPSSVYVWKISDSKIIRKFRIAAKPNVNSETVFSGDGKWIAVGSKLEGVKVFSLVGAAPAARGASAAVCEIPKPAAGLVSPVGFTADGHEVWVKSVTGFEKWRCAAGKRAERMVEGKVGFDRVFALRDGSFVGLKMGDGRVRLTEAESGKEIGVVLLVGRK